MSLASVFLKTSVIAGLLAIASAYYVVYHRGTLRHGRTTTGPQPEQQRGSPDPAGARPRLTLPNLVGIHVKKAIIVVSEENVDQARQNLREQQGPATTPQSLGFADERALRDALRKMMVDRLAYDVRQSMRDQVHEYLLANVVMDMPAQLDDGQLRQVIARRTVMMMSQRRPQEKVAAEASRLRRPDAGAEAAREWNLSAILAQLAADRHVPLEDAELDARIASIAESCDSTPAATRQSLERDGFLPSLKILIRDQRAVDTVLAEAEIEIVDLGRIKGDEDK